MVPAPGGEVILPTARDRQNHDEYRYATARRVGDTLYISGVIVFRGSGIQDNLADKARKLGIPLMDFR